MSKRRNYNYEIYVLAMNIIGASEEARDNLSEKTFNEIEDFARRMIAVSEEAQKEYEEMQLSLQAGILDKQFKLDKLNEKAKQAYEKGYQDGLRKSSKIKVGINNP